MVSDHSPPLHPSRLHTRERERERERVFLNVASRDIIQNYETEYIYKTAKMFQFSN